MRYLIDGHNLIAHLPDIDLADPDDEVRLIYKLRGFCARTGDKITVVFDCGVPGGVSTTLSTPSVTAIFASAQRLSADQVLLNQLRQIKNVSAYTLVSSDQEIIAAAQGLGIAARRAAAFAASLHPPTATEKDPRPRISASEVEEWLAIFSRRRDD